MNTKIILGVLGAVGYYEYTRYMKLVDSVSYKVRDFKINTTGQIINLSFIMDINNNTDKNLQIEKIEGNIYNGEDFIGNFRVNESYNIKSNAISSLPVLAIIDTADILELISKSFTTINTKFTINTNTNLKFEILGLIGIPVILKDTTTYSASNFLTQIKGVINKLKNK